MISSDHVVYVGVKPARTLMKLTKLLRVEPYVCPTYDVVG